MADDADIRSALATLAAVARRRLARHPLGHLAGREALPLELEVPLQDDTTRLDAAAEALGRRLGEELEGVLAHHAAFRPGRVFCLRCTSADCEHAAPPGPRQVFAGYGPSGLPRFTDFGQVLLERKHPRIDRLYATPPALVAEVISGRELAADLLPAFRDRTTDYRVHGQVIAGWFPVRRADGTRGQLALTFQVLSSAAGGGRRRLGLNVLGTGEDGEPLAAVCERLDVVPWASSVRWGQSVLDSVERSQGRKGATPERLSQRIAGMLGSIARRLEQGRRASDRRTAHADERHDQGDRPTRMAVVDLERADGERLLADTRRGTLVVLGGRGRTHVFSPAGKLVTSLRFDPDAVARRRKQGRWRPASEAEIAALRAAVGGGD